MNPYFFTAPFYFAFIWFRVQGSRFRVQGSGFKVQGSRFRVQGSGFRWRLRRLFLEDGILVSPFLVSLIACAIIQKGIMRNGD